MSLVDRWMTFAETHYAFDWAAVRRSVATELTGRPDAVGAVYDARRYPSYWCVPVLVGSYVGASRSAVRTDLGDFVAACIVRHFVFDADPPFDAVRAADRLAVVRQAYAGCRLDRTAASFDERFSAKCMPWTTVLAMGTGAIQAEADGARYASAMRAIILVHSCLQVIDDWHDRDEDVGRSLWNMWTHEQPASTRAAIPALLRGSRESVARLDAHLLRTALEIQLADTAAELRPLLTEAT